MFRVCKRPKHNWSNCYVFTCEATTATIATIAATATIAPTAETAAIAT